MHQGWQFKRVHIPKDNFYTVMFLAVRPAGVVAPPRTISPVNYVNIAARYYTTSRYRPKCIIYQNGWTICFRYTHAVWSELLSSTLAREFPKNKQPLHDYTTAYMRIGAKLSSSMPEYLPPFAARDCCVHDWNGEGVYLFMKQSVN